jgi:hypothetical protein
MILPTPIELARMHEAELKQCFRQYSVLGALVRQIMVGRFITTAASVTCEVTDVKLANGKVQIYGKPQGKKKQVLLCEGLGTVTIVERAKP